MKVSTQVRIITGGFLVAYLSGMAAMVTRSSERLGDLREPLLWKVLVPLIVVGIVVILVAKLLPASEDEESR